MIALAEKPNYYRITERLLYDYKTYDAAIRNLQERIEEIEPQLYPSNQLSADRVQTSQSITSTVERQVILMSEEEWRIRKQLTEKKRLLRAVREARTHLTQQESELVWMKYDMEKSHVEVQRALSMPHATYYRCKKQVVDKVAKCMGII